MANRTLDIGLGQGWRLCQKRPNERLILVSDGLPVILASAQGFWGASCYLRDMPREAEVLRGFAEEEAAKILILMDAIRCPPKLIASKISKIVSWFYSHLARLIYAESVSWEPMDVAQLRKYVDNERKAHYVDGYCGEYIMPNSKVYQRESTLYADIEAYDDGELGWNLPRGDDANLFPSFDPPALALVEAMSALGIFTHQGLRATADIWGKVEFKDIENYEDAEALTNELLQRLVAEGLTTETAVRQHASRLYSHWPLPMYGFEFSLVDVPLDDLKAEQDRLFRSEIGGY